jgi:hypothetical protein
MSVEASRTCVLRSFTDQDLAGSGGSAVVNHPAQLFLTAICAAQNSFQGNPIGKLPDKTESLWKLPDKTEFLLKNRVLAEGNGILKRTAGRLATAVVSEA